MSNFKQVLVVAMMAGAFVGCGRDNYNGKYTGYEQKIAPASTSGAILQYNTDERVELNLRHNGDIVSGTVSYPDSGLSGQFSAVSQNSNKLDQVEIRMGTNSQVYTGGVGTMNPNYTMGMNCVGTFSGSLSAPGNGKRLTGTLNALNSSNGTLGGVYSTCSGKNLTVNKN